MRTDRVSTGETDRMKQKLIQMALDARRGAYAPYSHYQVGAALLADDGGVFTGCNVENASYGASCCAERAAVFRAVGEGKRRFLAIAVAGGMEGREPVEYARPCGICRQVLREFAAGNDMTVIVAKSAGDYEEYSLSELLPNSFGGESIQ